MKKLTMIAVVLMIGAGFAYASTLSVPWFVDNAGTSVGNPPKTGGILGLVYLHNNLADTITCSIKYFDQDGDDLGPDYPDNTFTINPLCTISFRPVAYDPDATVVPGTAGQEGAQALAVPDRPMKTEFGVVGTKKNGSLVVSWPGSSGLVQGIYSQSENTTRTNGTANQNFYTAWGTLLPPGV